MKGFLLSRRAFIASLTATLATAGHAWAKPIGPAQLDRVRRVAIHPAIGIARVGNSPDAFYFGPEAPGGVPAGPFKDPSGAVARQAARFRVFGYDAQGEVVGELTAADVDIDWQVDVANAKGAWYDFDTAFDLEGAPGAGRRNADVTDRDSLVVRATGRTLGGAGTGPVPLDGGEFQGIPIQLGEAMTDAEGRLIVLPGAGAAYSVPDAAAMDGFADNSGWADDICDGPIGATVRIGDRSFAADPAWVMCVPPNYAPAIAESLVTTFDMIESALVDAGVRDASDTTFERDVWPIFRRMSDLQWVNEGFFLRHGFGALRDWASETWRERLADGSEDNRPLRESVLALFRDPAFAEVEPDAEPQIYGEKIVAPPNALEPRQWLALTPLQYRHLKAWAEGRFTTGGGEAPVSYEGHALRDRPAALDRAALDACIGGPFHPGIECTWVVRIPWIWTPDMRLAAPRSEVDRTDYGDTLIAPVATSKGGPLSRLGPGSLTQWMGVPWHADASSCRYGYFRAISPILPGFWPARIPNGVLAEVDYRIVMDTARSLDERRAAFARRRDWERFISAPTRAPILAAMAQDWFKLGFVTNQPGPEDGVFPAAMKVETHVGFDSEPEVLYPAGAIFPQPGQFPLVTANSDDNSLRIVDAEGAVTVMKLSGPLERPEGLMMGLDGNIYVCCFDANIIRRVTQEGEVSLFADGAFAKPASITGDLVGNFYVANYVKDGTITAIDPEGKSRVLVPASAGLTMPVGVVVAPDGDLLVSWGGNAVARVDVDTGKVLDPHFLSGLNNPRQMAFDTSHRLYLADQGDNAIRRYDMQDTPIPLTLMGADLPKPFGLAFDAKGLLFATITDGNLVKKIRIDGDVAVVSDFAADLRNGGGIAFIG